MVVPPHWMHGEAGHDALGHADPVDHLAGCLKHCRYCAAGTLLLMTDSSREPLPAPHFRQHNPLQGTKVSCTAAAALQDTRASAEGIRLPGRWQHSLKLRVTAPLDYI